MAGITIDDLRGRFGKDLSDDELVLKAADRYGVKAQDVASEIGYDTGGKWGNRGGAAVDAAQSQLLGATEDAAETLGLPGVQKWASTRRERNAGQAKAERRLAQEQGAVMDWRDVPGEGIVDTIKRGGEFVGGLALDSAPQMAATIGGGALGAAAGSVVPGVGTLAGGMAGAALAGAPFNYGDIRENMMEQSGTVDKAAALGLTVPYSMLDMVGGEGRLLRSAGTTLGRMVGREEVEQVGKQVAKKAADEAPSVFDLTARADRMTGVGGVAARRGLDFVKGGVSEGLSETGQEVVNQFGRMAVDPTVGLMTGDAPERYLDSFIGGAVLGGTMGAVHGAVAKGPLGDAARSPNAPQVAGVVADAATAPPGLVGPPPPNQQGPVRPSIPEDGLHGPAPDLMGPQVRQAVGAAMPVEPVPTPEEAQRKAEIDAIKQQAQADQERVDTVKKEHGFDNEKTADDQADAMIKLEDMKAAGAISPEAYTAQAALVQRGKLKPVNVFIKDAERKQEKAAAEAQKAVDAAQKKAEADAAAAAKKAEADAEKIKTTIIKDANTPPEETKAEGAKGDKPAPKPETPAPSPAPAPAPVPEKAKAVAGEVSPGMKVATALKGPGDKPMGTMARDRLFAMAGMDKDGWVVSDQRTLDQVAQIEADRAKAEGRKPVTRQAIQKQLKAFGITDELVKRLRDRATGTTAADTTTVAAAPGAAEDEVTLEGGREDATPTTSEGPEVDDTRTIGESMGEAAEGESTGMRVIDSPGASGILDPEGTPAQKQKATLKRLTKAREYSEGQRAQFARVADIKNDGERSAALKKVLANKEIFSDAERSSLAAIFESGRSEAAVARDTAAVEQQREIDAGPSPEQVAKNEAELARNEALLRQIEEETTAETLTDLLPIDMHNDIADAQESWEEDMMEGDPAWSELPADIQAQWVRAVVANATSPQIMTAGRLINRQEELKDETAQRKAEEDRRSGGPDEGGGQDTGVATAPTGAEVPQGSGLDSPAEIAESEAAAAAHAAGIGGPASLEAGAQQEPDAKAGEGNAGQGDVAHNSVIGPAEVLEPVMRSLRRGPPAIGRRVGQGAPSVKREVRRGVKAVVAEEMTPEQAIERLAEVQAQADMARVQAPVNPRVRGGDYVRQKLLEAKRNGWLNPQAVDFAEWLIRQNEGMVSRLGISMRTPSEDQANTAGFYTAANRVITLMKGDDSSDVAVHEILHHLERLMPPAMQASIQRMWARGLTAAYKRAQKGGTPAEKRFYGLLMNYHFGNGGRAQQLIAEHLLTSGQVPMENYQFFNSSEYWAVNGSRILGSRFGATNMGQRMMQWLRETFQHLKGLLGLRSDAPVLRAITEMLERGNDVNVVSPQLAASVQGVHRMYAGPKALNEEQQAQREKAEWLQSTGRSMEDIRQATGWFKGKYDSKWRYELNDAGARLRDFEGLLESKNFDFSGKDTHKYTLGQVLDHPAFFDAYPEAADIEFTKRAGAFDIMRNLQGGYGEGKMNVTPYAEDPLGTILHEMQHWVQEQEGFAWGGNSDTVMQAMNARQLVEMAMKMADEKDETNAKERARVVAARDLLKDPAFDNMLSLRNRMDRLRDQMRDLDREDPKYKLLYKQWENTDSALDKFKNEHVRQRYGVEKAHQLPTPEYMGLADALRAKTFEEAEGNLMERGGSLALAMDKANKLREGDIDTIKSEAKGSKAAYAAYRNIAGEIEARDVTARQKMTADERAATAPLSSEPEPARKDVILTRAVSGAASEERLNSLRVVSNAAVARVPDRAKPAVKTMGRIVANSTKKLVRGLTFTHDLIRMAAKGIPSAVRYGQLQEIRNAAKIKHLHEADRIVSGYKGLTEPQRAAVNAFIKKSTIEGRWGYQPKHLNITGKLDLDPVLEHTYANMKPEQQAVVRDVFEHGHKTLMSMKDAVKANVATEFDALIADAERRGEEKAVAKLVAEKDQQLKQFESLLNIGEGHPYAPLKRFGNHVVVGKSQAYADAEAALDADPDDKVAAKALREMQSQPQHYYVAFRETEHEAQAHADTLTGYAHTDTMQKDSNNYFGQVGGNKGLLGMFHRLRKQASDSSEGLGAKARQATDRMMTDMYLSLLSETSARQSERERRNVGGADEDMMRAFHSKARADANFLAALQTGGDIQNSLNAMEKEAKRNGEQNGTTRNEREALYRELLERHVMDMDYKQSPFVDKAMSASSIMQLITNPAYHLTNLLQPYVMSAPAMAGRFGMARSLNAVMQAHRTLGTSLFKDGISHTSVDSLPLEQYEREGLKRLLDMGRINMSLDTEHGADWQPGLLGKVLNPFKKVSERAEAVNRVATAVAALRLATKGGMSLDNAVNYASKIIYDTHGDYSGFNTPSLMRGPVARLATQYRKFQIIQISNYVRMFNDGFANANLSKEEQWVARKALAYNLATMFTLGGTMALPGAQLISVMLRAIFGDDDEPNDPESTMRKYIGDEDLANLLVKGVPAWMGVDVSGRLGAGNIASLFPYAKTEKGYLSREAMESYVLGAAGPFLGGLLPKLGDGVSSIASGDVYKGVENLMPSGISGILKGARIATEGITMKNGDTVMQPEDVSLFAGLMQAAGLPTTTVTNRQYKSNARYISDQFYKDQSTEVTRSYVRAYRAGDAEAMSEARQAWNDVQASRRANGYTVQPLSTLLKAPQQAGKREKTTVEGIQSNKNNRKFVEQLAEIS